MGFSTNVLALQKSSSARTSCKTETEDAEPTKAQHSPSRSFAFSSRLKREDHPLPRSQDQLFSEWKILVGTADWEKFYAGEEGARRYRTHNVQGTHNGPGVYELGLCPNELARKNRTGSSRHPKKTNVVVVYLGQAGNLNERMQQYGRDGSHLEGGADVLKALRDENLDKQLQKLLQTETDAAKRSLSILNKNGYLFDPPCLFSKAFSQGYSIAFRWAAAAKKADAVAIETGLLNVFDYAWNRENNGERRSLDGFKRMQQIIAYKKWYNKPSKWINAIKTGSNIQKSDLESQLLMIVSKDKLSSNPINVLDEPAKPYAGLNALPWGVHEYESKPKITGNVKPKQEPCFESEKEIICGIIDASGQVCKQKPPKGRKRCEQHKGMRIISSPCKANVGSEVCGYPMGDGSKCMVFPVKGRKRCTAHKGLRI